MEHDEPLEGGDTGFLVLAQELYSQCIYSSLIIKRICGSLAI